MRPRRPMPTAEQWAILDEAWRIAEPIVAADQARHPGLDLEDLAREQICRHAPYFDAARGVSLEGYVCALVRYARLHALRFGRPLGYRRMDLAAPHTFRMGEGPYGWWDLPDTRPAEAEEEEGHEAAWFLLRSLPERDAELVWLRHVEGYSVVEIARRTGLKQLVVKGRLQRALVRLRAHARAGARVERA